MDVHAMSKNTNTEKVGWRINEFSDAVGICRAFTYQLLNDGKIESVKIGNARIITTSPGEFLRRHEGRGGEL
jgi:hypothetical protein